MRGDTAGPDLSALEKGERLRADTPSPGLSTLDKPQTSTRPGPLARLQNHFAEEVTNSHADVLLLLCCVISGFLDSAIYNGMVRFPVALRNQN